MLTIHIEPPGAPLYRCWTSVADYDRRSLPSEISCRNSVLSRRSRDRLCGGRFKAYPAGLC